MQTYKNTKRVWGPRDRINRRKGKENSIKRQGMRRREWGLLLLIGKRKKGWRKTFEKEKNCLDSIDLLVYQCLTTTEIIHEKLNKHTRRESGLIDYMWSKSRGR